MAGATTGLTAAEKDRIYRASMRPEDMITGESDYEPKSIDEIFDFDDENDKGVKFTMKKKNYGQRILAKDFYVSNNTRETGLNNNDLIIGSSGSGKTGGYVIPNIQNINGSLVVSDSKGQLRRRFEKELKEKGYDVYCLDFVNPEKSCSYNPLKAIRRRRDGSYYEKDVLTLAHVIMPQDLDSKEPFWGMAAESYLVFLIAYCLDALPPEEQNMFSVCELHRVYTESETKQTFHQFFRDNPDCFSARKHKSLRCTMGADKMWSSIFEFVNRGLELFDFKEARTLFSDKNAFDILQLGEKKTVLFINVSDTDSTFDRMVNMFYAQALNLLCTQADNNPEGQLKVPVRIIMDDFAASAKLPDFDKIISVIRSRDISVSLILQSMTQLESMYRHAEAMTIINNCDHILYLGNQDLETAEFVERRAEGLGINESPLCLPLDKVILITKGKKAKTVDKLMPYSTV